MVHWLLYYIVSSGLLVTVSAMQIGKTYNYDAAVDFDSLETPDQLVEQLNEEEFEDYLDFWLYRRTLNSKTGRQERMSTIQGGCVIPIKDLKEPLPIFANGNALLRPYGTSGNVVLGSDSIVEASCSGINNGLQYSTAKSDYLAYGTLTCRSGKIFTSSWMSEALDFMRVHCMHRTNITTVQSSEQCSGGGVKISSILHVDSQTHAMLTSCFDPVRSKVLYVEYEQNPEHAHGQPQVVRPGFNQGSHFPDLSVDNLYLRETQKETFDEILGPSMNLRYLNSTFFLSRGHLAAKTDFVFAPEQRATFTFVNAAPQWQFFNGGNWNTLEQQLRLRIADAGYKTKIITGTWGILKLQDYWGELKEIFLHPRTQQIPVPLWYYKLVYEPSLQKGVVFLGLNNPYVTLNEAQSLAFCTDLCEDNPDYSWLNWRPNDIGRGYSICCSIDDFKKTVSFLPDFTVTDILS